MITWKEVATETLDTQLTLLNFYKSERGRDYMIAFVGDRVEKGYMLTPARETFADLMAGYPGESTAAERYVAVTGLILNRELIDTLSYADTFLVTNEMMDLTVHAAAQLSSINFSEADLPADRGFVMLPRPLITLDTHEKRMAWRAFAWWKTTTTIQMKDQSVRTPSVMFATFSTKADAELDDTMIEVRRDFPRDWLRWEQWQLCHWCPLTLHGATGTVLDEHGNEVGQIEVNSSPMPNQRAQEEREDGTAQESSYAFLRSFFLLVKQKIGVARSQHPERAGLRRWTRAGLPPEYGDVQVVTLRKSRPASEHEVADGTPVNWTHRWMVSGHWRDQFYASCADCAQAGHACKGHEQLWIEAFEKGPADKPLVVTDKVFVWRR